MSDDFALVTVYWLIIIYLMGRFPVSSDGKAQK